MHARTLEDEAPRQTDAEKALVGRLLSCWPAAAPPPLLLCDRGFDKGPLLSWLIERQVRFIVRVQRDHHLYDRYGGLLNDDGASTLGYFPAGPLHSPVGKARLFPKVTYYQHPNTAGFSGVYASVVDKNGKVWVNLMNADRVARFDPKMVAIPDGARTCAKLAAETTRLLSGPITP